MLVHCIMSFLCMFHSVSPRAANELRVALSTENGQSDYICASFLDVSPAQTLDCVVVTEASHTHCSSIVNL